MDERRRDGALYLDVDNSTGVGGGKGSSVTRRSRLGSRSGERHQRRAVPPPTGVWSPGGSTGVGSQAVHDNGLLGGHHVLVVEVGDQLVPPAAATMPARRALRELRCSALPELSERLRRWLFVRLGSVEKLRDGTCTPRHPESTPPCNPRDSRPATSRHRCATGANVTPRIDEGELAQRGHRPV